MRWNNRNRNQRPIQTTGYQNNLSMLAFICGIMSLVTVCCMYSGIVLGALGILFGLLSRGKADRPSFHGRMGMYLGIAAIAATIVLYLSSYVSVIAQYGSFAEYLQEYMESLFGIDADTAIETL